MGLVTPSGPCEGCGSEDGLVFYEDPDGQWFMEVCRDCREELWRQEAEQILEEILWAQRRAR